MTQPQDSKPTVPQEVATTTATTTTGTGRGPTAAPVAAPAPAVSKPDARPGNTARDMRLAPQGGGGGGGTGATSVSPPKPGGPDGSSPLNARPFVIAGALVVILLVGGLGSWATLTQIAGAIISTGQIEVDRNRQVVQHPDGGVVSEILVDEGDTVEADQVLVRIDGTLLQSELTVVENQYYELVARRGRLEAERDGATEITFDPELLEVAPLRPEVANLMDGQVRLFDARMISLEKSIDQLSKRRAQIGNQIDGVIAQQDALGKQLAFLRDELADQMDLLNKGLAQKTRVLSLQREEARLAGSLGELMASQAESEGRMTELDIEVLKLETTRREEAITQLRDLQYRELELGEQRRALIERLSRLDIKAPVSGIVYGLQVYAERSVIRAADQVLFLVPQDRPLVIATRVDPIHIDKVYPGQEVIVRLSALDARTTPELYGIVTVVSADAFVDEQSGASYYRAEVVLKEGEMARLPEETKLLPGMPVDAYLRTDDRTPLGYLVKPLADYFNKAFRES